MVSLLYLSATVYAEKNVCQTKKIVPVNNSVPVGTTPPDMVVSIEKTLALNEDIYNFLIIIS